MENIVTVFVTDDKYVQHLGVTLTSLFEHKSCSNELICYIVSGGLQPDNEQKIKRIFEKYHSQVHFLNIGTERYSSLSVKNHMSHAAYYKISIPDLLPEHNKVLFLDCDLVIKQDLLEIWETDLRHYCLAAVENPGFDRYEQLKIPIGSRTFNSGVMLLNLEAWRKQDIPSQVMAFLTANSHRTALHDQDGFNAVMYDKWLPLKPKWNQQTKFFEIKHHDTQYDEASFFESIHKPAIIHYTTSSKPWQYVNSHPYKSEYYKYLKLTEWRNFKVQDKNVKNFIKKVIIKISPSKLINTVRKQRLKKKNKFIYN